MAASSSERRVRTWLMSPRRAKNTTVVSTIPKKPSHKARSGEGVATFDFDFRDALVDFFVMVICVALVVA